MTQAYDLAMARVTSQTFVGRASELEALDRALAAAEGGIMSTVLIGGDPGVGKSRLLQAWNERAALHGARIAAGSCLDLGETGPAFTAVIEALRELLRDDGAGGEAGLAGADRQVLARLIPELGPAPGPDAADAPLSTLGQTRLFERLAEVLRGAAASGPVVLELEDVHWADQSSQAFLLYLVEVARNASILLLCTYRADAAETNDAFRSTLSQLLRRPAVTTLSLAPFDEDELREQLTGILGRPPSIALLRAIAARSEGNALFTEELAAASDPSVDLPTSVGAATAAKVRSLSRDTRSVLRVASVIGRTATYDVIRAVTSLDDEALANSLREAVEARLLEPVHVGEAYRFRHALIQEAIYGDTLPGERRRLHAAVAHALSADPDVPPDDADLAPRLARHWFEGHDYPRAFAASRAAAAAAERQTAYAEALTHNERLIDLWDRAGDAATTGGTRARVLEHAGWLAFLAGELERSAAHGQAALAELDRTSDERHRIRVLDRLAWTLERLGRDYWPISRSIAAMDPDVRSSDERIRIYHHRAMCLDLDGKPAAALKMAREAMDLADPATDLYMYADGADVVANIQQMWDVDEAIRVLESASDVALRAGDDVIVADKRTTMVGILDRHRRFDQVLSVAPDVIDFVGRVGLGPWVRPYLRCLVALSYLRVGRLDDAHGAIDLAMEDAPQGIQLAVIEMVAAQLSIATGALEDAAMHLEASRLPDTPPEVELRRGGLATVRAALAIAERRWDDAQRIVEGTASLVASEPTYTEISETIQPLVEAGLAAVAEKVEYARAAGETDQLAEAAEAVSRLTGWVDAVRGQRERVGFPDLGEMRGYEALIAAHLARIEGQPAPDLWAAAAEAFPPRSVEALTARYRQGEAMLTARAPRDEVGAVIAPACEIAVQIGARPLAYRFEVLARRARIDLRARVTPPATVEATPAADEPDESLKVSAGEIALRKRGLSSREIEVLALVASGWSNSQIAKRLFIGNKTASVHVSHILAKLGVSSRIDAATLAVRLGLPEVGADDL